MSKKTPEWRPMSRAEFEVLLSRNRILGKETNPEEEYLSYAEVIRICVEVVHQTRMYMAKSERGLSKWHYEKIGEWLTKSIRKAYGGRYYKKDYE